ncbi:MAG: hypothetical protein ED557_07980 [Balneola sp.]|nr:MAG: hypothetical protein ED557_07980 [Balneola sp.]
MTDLFKSNKGCFTWRQPLLFALILILFIGCKEEPVHRDYEVLFEVNGIERTVFDFESNYVEHLIKTGRNDTRRERYDFLNQMIDNLVLGDAAEARGLLDHPTYLGALYFQERKSMMDFYFVDEMGKLIDPPTDEEVRLAYAKKQRKVFVRQLFSLQEEELLESYDRLRNGEDFIDVANDFFETEEYDENAGYLGPISYFGVDDAFAEAAFSTNQGEFTAPVRSRFGFHIIYVEYIEFPAMLAEDDYQYRKPGISSQVKLRKQQIVSNDYVRDLMGSLSVEPDAENLSALREVILQLDGDEIANTTSTNENQPDRWTDQRLEELEASFDNETILATYVFGGERADFTFEDYLNWLPYLPFIESKNRTGASVGRGMRNEVLFKIAEREGYKEDDRVIGKVKERGYDILSDLYQYELTLEALTDTSTITVPNTFRDRLINNRHLLLKAGYWKIYAEDLSEAERIKADIQNGELPISYDTYEEVDYQTIDPSNKDFDLVQKSLIKQPILAFSATDGWMVLNVTDREVTEVSNTTAVADIETRFKVYSTINGEIEELREAAVIKVDTLLFDNIYEVWNREKESS